MSSVLCFIRRYAERNLALQLVINDLYWSLSFCAHFWRSTTLFGPSEWQQKVQTLLQFHLVELFV